MFNESIGYVANSMLPEQGVMSVGTLVIALLPTLSTGLPGWMRAC